jgi:hypothetical protein
MTTIPSGLIEKMDAFTRHPTLDFGVSWNNALISGEWFRLDEGYLDSGSIMTLEPYLESEEILEIVTNADAKIYANESEYVKVIEGFSELVGDNFQYSMSEMDVELDNAENRFTPRTGVNKLNNPGFELSKKNWHENLGASGIAIIDEDIHRTGIRSMLLHNNFFATEGMNVFSERMEANGGDQLDIPEIWTFSDYIQGAGNANLRLISFGINNNNIQDIETGYLGEASYQFTLTSGEWARPSVSYTIPSGSYYVRAVITSSGSFLRADDGVVEEGTNISAYDPDFIGNYILPKRPVKLQIGFSNINVPKFSGLTNKITPKLKEDSTQIYAYDWANLLKDKKITQTFYENLRTDEIIALLAGLGGIDSLQMSLETGKLTVEFAWFQEGSVWFYLTQVAEAEGGRIFFDEEGILTFWNRDHFDSLSNVIYSFTFASHIQDLNYDISSSKVKNRIEVKANPKKLLTNKVIHTQTETQQISAGDTQEFWGQYAYGDDKSVPAINVQTPVIGTDIIANTQEDGLGVNISSYITISSSSVFIESSKINLQNSYGAIAYITKFQLKGDPIVTKSRIEVVKEDTDSISLYDTQILAIENDLIDTDGYAGYIASQKLYEMKDPHDFITIEVVGVPYLVVGDRVNVQRSFGGETEDFHVISNRWRMEDDFTQTLELEKKSTISWFTLDITTLDSTDLLYT